MPYLSIKVYSEKQDHQQWYTIRIYCSDLTWHICESWSKSWPGAFFCLWCGARSHRSGWGKEKMNTWLTEEEQGQLESAFVSYSHPCWSLPVSKPAALLLWITLRTSGALAADAHQQAESEAATEPNLHPPFKSHNGYCSTVTFQIFHRFLL